MAASGYTPISLYYSTTSSAVPSGSNLVYGELAINIADGKLYFKNSSNVVTLLADAATSALTIPVTVPNGGTGLTSVTAGRIPYGNGTSALNTSSSLQFLSGVLVVGPSSALGGTTNPFLAVTGNDNNYIQQYIYNANTGTSASADYVAYADNSTDAHGWMDMGFTSSVYADATYTVTGANEGYLFASAPSGSGATGNMVFATDSTGTANNYQFYVGGFTQAKTAWKLQLTSTLLQTPNVLQISKNTGTLPSLTTGALAQIANADGTQTRVLLDTFGTSTSAGVIHRKANGTAASPSALLANDVIAVWSSLGYGATGYASATRQSIQSFASENWTDTAQGTYLSILTTATGGTSTTEKYRFGPSGELGIGGATYGSSGNVFVSGGTGAAPSWTAQSSLSVGTATNIAGGTTDYIVYQSAPGTTAFASVGSGLSLSGGVLSATGGSGSVTSITAGTGLTGGTITTSGTIAVDTTVVATTSNTVTLTNKRVTPRVGTTTSAATITPTADLSDQYTVTALATTATFAVPSGTPTDGQKLTIRIKDNGTGQTLNWTTSAGGYRIIGTTLPTSTTATKTIYVGCIYNSADGYWDVVSVATQA